MKDTTKKRLLRTLNVFLDVIVTLALVTSLTFAIIISVRRFGNGFAGYGTVSSESMTASGLNVGDVVRVRPQDEYAEGDIIVFYRAPQDYGAAFEKSNADNYMIWIHEVIAVKDDPLGRTAYLTKGSSNASDDGYFVPQDFVLGKASKLSDAAIALINFICSIQGIILLVEVPCGIVLVYLVWELVMLLTKDKKGKCT